MKRLGLPVIVLSSIAVCFMATGCFFYSSTTKPVPVTIEPLTPTATTMTTTTTDPNGNVQKRTSTTYANPY